MIVKKGSDWKRYIVNCSIEDAYDKCLAIRKKGGKILGWSRCPELQAIVYGEKEVDIWVEIVSDNKYISEKPEIE